MTANAAYAQYSGQLPEAAKNELPARVALINQMLRKRGPLPAPK